VPPPTDPQSTLNSALTGRYAIEREIGAGGMATVYLAQDVRHHRKVAIKVLRPDLSASLGGAERFLAEVRTTAALQHPNIVPLFDSGEAAGFVFYVMPFVAGETLRARLEREKTLDTATTIAIARGVALALTAAHDAGLVHRDIKPENILLVHGQPMVADFGIARAVGTAGAERLTTVGLTLGSPAYMSPEQVLGDDNIDARSDIYSLGCVIHEMLSGHAPFTGSTAQQIMARRIVGPPPELTSVSPALADVVRRSLATAPQDRFQTALALADALAEAAHRPAAADLSIVVLPFANLSPDPDNEYFADGLMEEVIADLSKVRALRVISRNSAMQLKGTTDDTRSIGRRLNVRYVLTGSVRKAGNSLRITAQLVDAANDAQLWAEKYGGTTDDVFELQERLSREIVTALEVTLTPAEEERIAERPVQTAQAFEYFSRARHDLWGYTPESIARGRSLLNAALASGAASPALYGLLGMADVHGVVMGEPEEEGFARAEEWAKKAFALDPSSVDGHTLMCLIAYRRGDASTCVRHGEAALRVDPANVDIRIHLCSGLLLAGRHDRARKVIEPALSLDPFNALVYAFAGLPVGGDAERCIAPLRRSIEIDPQFPPSRVALALCFAQLGRHDDALKELVRLAQNPTSDPFTQVGLRLLHALSGDAEAARQPLTDAERAAAKGDESFGYFLAAAYCQAGDHAAALEWLEHSVKVRGWMDYMFLGTIEPWLHDLRSDARFQELMAYAKHRHEAFDA
jgi:serine/threonine-protein kinase